MWIETTKEGKRMTWQRATIDSAGNDIKTKERIIIPAHGEVKIETDYRFTDDMQVETTIEEIWGFGLEMPEYKKARFRIDKDNPMRGYMAKPVVLNKWVGLIFPRSSLGFKGMRLKNTTGVIDMDYRDPIKFILCNDGNEDIIIEEGDRFAQLIFMPFGTVKGEEKPMKERQGGIGSTGK